jgi:hypothetical protein
MLQRMRKNVLGRMFRAMPGKMPGAVDSGPQHMVTTQEEANLTLRPAVGSEAAVPFAFGEVGGCPYPWINFH